ncbi:GDSL lipase/esterase [Circinella umbellata]|nr:GDSL lipase/esterase [Circinella umbellata]
MLLLPIVIGLTSLFWQQSIASSVKNLVVFGDSYSDVGNLQRLSNGPFWSENLAVGWDASIYSFAYNGAVCDNDLFASDTSNAMPSIKDQIDMYYNEQLNLEPNETVYAFWVGLNDIDLAFKQENGTSLWGDIVDCISTQMRNVRKVFGSNRYLVINIPPMEKMPYFNGDEKRKEATEALNERLSKSVTSLNKHYRALEMDLVDVHSMVNDLVENPSKFGFKDASHAYWDECQGQCTDGLDEYLWWDKVHLTGGKPHYYKIEKFI